MNKMIIQLDIGNEVVIPMQGTESIGDEIHILNKGIITKLYSDELPITKETKSYMDIVKLQKRAEMYEQALNNIDDYFEYSHYSTRDKEFVMGVLNNLAKKMKVLYETTR